MSARQRLTFAAIAAAIAVVAVVVLASGGGSDNGSTTADATPTATAGGTATATAAKSPEAAPQGATIVVKGGQPVGGVEKIEVSQGDRLAFAVRSDVADEVHVHGYDLHKDVAAGGKVSFDFPARITGVFEVELENAGVQLASLTVNP